MISSQKYDQAYVWIWLPEATKPVVAGKLTAENNALSFNYGRSYLERANAVSLYEPELPLRAGAFSLLAGMSMPSCIRDGAPDAWGRRVIINKKLGLKGKTTDNVQLDELTFLLESGSDRIGALDFQLSPTDYVPRTIAKASLTELLESAERVENGIPLSPELDQALNHGTAIGGARPKALIEGNHKKYIAKFSSSRDLYNVIKAEFIAMRLARLSGLNVAEVELTKSSNKDVLLIERFDRISTQDGWQRKSLLSALTILGLDEMMARYASYETFAGIIRAEFINAKSTLRELFSRLVFNILCGNTDDHARNHAAFWNGKELSLTPAYDICPQGRAGNEASQAMLISGNNNLSQLKTCLETAHTFLLSEQEARDIFEKQKTVIKSNWNRVCDEAQLSIIDRKLFWGRQFLNRYSIEE
ncbi:MAG: type II toxin-antitoxin system HipA family toxin [Enterobacterales bacterium]|nr:type II toxin-antitoxin system HipA family toxin [Enterobacterales bacterium]